MSRIGYSSHSFRQSAMEWGSVSPFAARSSKRMAGGFAAVRTQAGGRSSASPLQPPRRMERPMPAERTVHVVDDDAAIRRSLEQLLGAAGFHVVSYDTPLAFLDVALGLLPGCVLLDIKMPEMDGLELQALMLKGNIPWPVIVMSGHGDVQSAVRAMKAGAVDFLEKPYSDELLLMRSRGGSGELAGR